MMRWLNNADVVLKEKDTETFHLYFFGYDELGIPASYNIRAWDVFESTVEYGDEDSFIEEIHDMMETNHYKVIKGMDNIPEPIIYNGADQG